MSSQDIQNDKDTKQAAGIVTEYLDESKIKVLGQLTLTPELNSIENLWAYFDKKKENRNNQKLEKLKVIVREQYYY